MSKVVNQNIFRQNSTIIKDKSYSFNEFIKAWNILQFIDFLFLNFKIKVINYTFFFKKNVFYINSIVSWYNNFKMQGNNNKVSLNFKEKKLKLRVDKNIKREKLKFWNKYLKLLLEKIVYQNLGFQVHLIFKNLFDFFKYQKFDNHLIGREFSNVNVKRNYKFLMHNINMLGYFGSCNFFSEFLANYLTAISNKKEQKRNIYKFFRLLKSILRFRSKILGIKIKIAGRINGRMRKSKILWKLGTLPLQSLNKNIAYSYKKAYNRFGAYGIKVWVNIKH